MSETKAETETKEDPNPEAIEFWRKIGEGVTEDYKKYIEAQMRSDVCQDGGEIYYFKKIAGKDIIRFKKLDAESFKIQDKDSQQFYDNVKARACIVIKDMTPEKFDEGTYSTLENLTTAWSRTALGGFRLPEPRITNDLPNGQKTPDGL